MDPAISKGSAKKLKKIVDEPVTMEEMRLRLNIARSNSGSKTRPRLGSPEIKHLMLGRQMS